MTKLDRSRFQRAGVIAALLLSLLPGSLWLQGCAPQDALGLVGQLAGGGGLGAAVPGLTGGALPGAPGAGLPAGLVPTTPPIGGLPGALTGAPGALGVPAGSLPLSPGLTPGLTPTPVPGTVPVGATAPGQGPPNSPPNVPRAPASPGQFTDAQAAAADITFNALVVTRQQLVVEAFCNDPALNAAIVYCTVYAGQVESRSLPNFGWTQTSPVIQALQAANQQPTVAGATRPGHALTIQISTLGVPASGLGQTQVSVYGEVCLPTPTQQAVIGRTKTFQYTQ